MLTTTEGEATPILIVRDAWLLDLGRKPYREVWELQKALVDRSRGPSQRDVPRLRPQRDDGPAGVPQNPAMRPRRGHHDLDGEVPRAPRRLGGRESVRHRPLPGRVRGDVSPGQPQRAVAGTAGGAPVAPPLSAFNWRTISGTTSNRSPTIP